MKLFKSIGVKGIGFLVMLMLCLGLSGSIVMAEEMDADVEAVTSSIEEVTTSNESEQVVQENYLAVSNNEGLSTLITETNNSESVSEDISTETAVSDSTAAYASSDVAKDDTLVIDSSDVAKDDALVIDSSDVAKDDTQVIDSSDAAKDDTQVIDSSDISKDDTQDTDQQDVQEESAVDISNSEEVAESSSSTGIGMGSIGEAHILGIYLDFQDIKFDANDSLNDFLKIINDEGGSGSPAYPYESLYAYYQRASYGRLKITGDVISYTAKNTRQWYIDNGGIEVLAKEVVEAIDADTDFKKYDTNGNADGSPDGVVDGLYLHCAGGCTEGWATTFWSSKHTYDLGEHDGVTFQPVVVLHYSSNSSDGMTCIIHETGHVLGLPDLYSYVAAKEKVEWRTGTLTWDMMDHNSGDIDAYFKWILGWIDYKDITRVVANEDGVSVYQGNDLNENITVNQDESGSWVDINLLAFDTDQMTETGGFIIVSNQNAQTEEEAKYSNFFMIVLDQFAGNQSFNYMGTSKIPTGFRIYKIQAEKKDGSYVYTNTNGTKHNILIECMDYDYAVLHNEAKAPYNMDGSYGCYLPVGEIFSYNTYPSTNFKENSLTGFTGIWFQNISVDTSAGQGVMRIGYSNEGSPIDLYDVELKYDNNEGVIDHSYLTFISSRDIEKGISDEVYVYVNGIEHLVSLEIDGNQVKIFMSDFNLDDIQEGDIVKIVFPEGSFQTGYDKNNNKIYNKELEMVLNVGPAAQITEKLNVTDVFKNQPSSNYVTNGDKVYQVGWDNLKGALLVCMDKMNPENENIISINGCQEKSSKFIDNMILYAAGDNRVLMLVNTTEGTCNYYWIDTETGNVIASTPTNSTFSEEDSSMKYAVTSDGKFYKLSGTNIKCYFEENGQAQVWNLSTDSSLYIYMNGMTSSQDPLTGEKKLLLLFNRDYGKEIKLVDEQDFFEILRESKDTYLDTDKLYALEDESYISKTDVSFSVLGVIPESDYQTIVFGINNGLEPSYELYKFDKDGNILAKVKVESATEIPDMQFNKITYGGNGQIAILGKTGSKKPYTLGFDYYEVILLRQAELSDYSSTLECGQYFCVSNSDLGYWKDESYFVAITNVLSKYDSQADDSKQRAYIIKVGDSRDYVITDGDGSVYTVGVSSDASQGKTLTIVCNGELKVFTELRIDGVAIDSSSYTVQSGSTIVNLNPAYLLTLSVGAHSIQFIYKHGTSNVGSFTIEALKEQENKDQGNGVMTDQTSANNGTKVVSKAAKASPNTGDQNAVSMYLMMLLFAAGGLCIGMKKYRTNVSEQ